MGPLKGQLVSGKRALKGLSGGISDSEGRNNNSDKGKRGKLYADRAEVWLCACHSMTFSI
jgi:hypothetical protein